jgi:hypothetical protein
MVGLKINPINYQVLHNGSEFHRDPLLKYIIYRNL